MLFKIASGKKNCCAQRVGLAEQPVICAMQALLFTHGLAPLGSTNPSGFPNTYPYPFQLCGFVKSAPAFPGSALINLPSPLAIYLA